VAPTYSCAASDHDPGLYCASLTVHIKISVTLRTFRLGQAVLAEAVDGAFGTAERAALARRSPGVALEVGHACLEDPSRRRAEVLGIERKRAVVSDPDLKLGMTR
jgi:hypothetical protein